MRRLLIHLFFLTLLLLGCTPPTATPSATQVVETVALPPVWTMTPRPLPSATKTPSPPTATTEHVIPSSTPAPNIALIDLYCPPVGRLTEVARSTTSTSPLDLEILGNYAYVSDIMRLWIFDITVPSLPIDAGYKFVEASDQLLISGAYAYGIDTEGLWKLNLSNPIKPAFLAYKDTPDIPLDFAIAGDHVFIRDDHGNLRTFDLSSTSLREVGVYDSPGKNFGSDSGGNRVTDLAYKNPFHSFSIQGNYAYVADLDAGLRVIDITDPTKPREVDSYDLSSSISDVEVIQDILLVFGVNLGTENVWDVWGQKIPDLIKGSEPTFLGTITIPEAAKPEVMCRFISEFSLLISESELKVAFAEIQPEEIVDILKGVDVVGDFIYVADNRRGLLILQFEPMEE